MKLHSLVFRFRKGIKRLKLTFGRERLLEQEKNVLLLKEEKVEFGKKVKREGQEE